MDLDKWLDSAKKSIFRFEFLQEYKIKDEEDFDKRMDEQFLKTGEVDMSLMKEWHDFIRSKTSSGVEMRWVRLVVIPINFYTKLSLHIYRKRLEFGIDIMVITQENFDKLNIKVNDFYLIDDENVLLMNYDDKKDFLGVTLDNKSLKKYLGYKKLLLENSVPVGEFK